MRELEARETRRLVATSFWVIPTRRALSRSVSMKTAG
jgi:hypothetical protein